MKSFRSFLYVILFLLFFCAPLFGQGHLPQDTVSNWIEVYGVDQVRASELTTLRLRYGRSKEVWAEETAIPLKQIGYKHLGGKYLGEKIRDDRLEAMVVLRAKIDSIVGISEQTEVYILTLEEGKWLIDEVIVRDEVDADELEKKLEIWGI